jgi:hypothetical protein
MACKPGYHGPLCALCDDGYFKSVRDCVVCEHPRVGMIVAIILGLLVLIALLLFLARRYHHYLDHAAAFSRECYIVTSRKSKPYTNRTNPKPFLSPSTIHHRSEGGGFFRDSCNYR